MQNIENILSEHQSISVSDSTQNEESILCSRIPNDDPLCFSRNLYTNILEPELQSIRLVNPLLLIKKDFERSKYDIFAKGKNAILQKETVGITYTESRKGTPTQPSEGVKVNFTNNKHTEKKKQKHRHYNHHSPSATYSDSGSEQYKANNESKTNSTPSTQHFQHQSSNRYTGMMENVNVWPEAIVDHLEYNTISNSHNPSTSNGLMNESYKDSFENGYGTAPSSRYDETGEEMTYHRYKRPLGLGQFSPPKQEETSSVIPSSPKSDVVDVIVHDKNKNDVLRKIFRAHRKEAVINVRKCRDGKGKGDVIVVDKNENTRNDTERSDIGVVIQPKSFPTNSLWCKIPLNIISYKFSSHATSDEYANSKHTVENKTTSVIASEDTKDKNAREYCKTREQQTCPSYKRSLDLEDISSTVPNTHWKKKCRPSEPTRRNATDMKDSDEMTHSTTPSSAFQTSNASEEYFESVHHSETSCHCQHDKQSISVSQLQPKSFKEPKSLSTISLWCILPLEKLSNLFCSLKKIADLAKAQHTVEKKPESVIPSHDIWNLNKEKHVKEYNKTHKELINRPFERFLELQEFLPSSPDLFCRQSYRSSGPTGKDITEMDESVEMTDSTSSSSFQMSTLSEELPESLVHSETKHGEENSLSDSLSSMSFSTSTTVSSSTHSRSLKTLSTEPIWCCIPFEKLFNLYILLANSTDSANSQHTVEKKTASMMPSNIWNVNKEKNAEEYFKTREALNIRMTHEQQICPSYKRSLELDYFSSTIPNLYRQKKYRPSEPTGRDAIEMMAGRKSKIDKNELIGLLKTFKTEIANALGKSTDPLWKTLCSRLDNKISPSGLYLFMQNNGYNRHRIIDLIEKEVVSECDGTDEDTSQTFQRSKIRGLYMEETLVLDFNIWSSLLSPDKSSLKNGWTYFFEHITSQLKTSCDWMFKSHALNVTDIGCYFNCQGYCVECNASINVWCPKKPQDFVNVTLNLKLYNVNQQKHSCFKNRLLSGTKKEEISKRLCDRKIAVNRRRENISEYSSNRCLYSLDVLRRAKIEFKEGTEFKDVSPKLSCIAKHDAIFTKKLEVPDEIKVEMSEANTDEDKILKQKVLLSEQFLEGKEGTNIDLEYIEPLKVTENWKGLAEKKKRTSYNASPNPEIMHIEHTKKIELELIKNGSIENATKTTNGESIILTNTCPYDSIIQAISCAYCDSLDYSHHFDSLFNSVVLHRIVKCLVNEGYSMSFKLQRIDLLKNICPSEILVNNTISINCLGNIATAYEKICGGLESVTEYYKCSVCSFEWNNKKKVIYLVIQNFNELKEKLEQYLRDNIKCKKCFHQNELSINIGKQIFIDCELTKASIKDLPIILNLRTKLTLRSAIIYSGTPNNIGHYYTVSRRNDGVWKSYNDMHNKVTIARTSVLRNFNALIYTI